MEGREPGANPRSTGGRDRVVLYAARTLRAFGAGALAIALALDLATAYSDLVAGLFLGVATVAASAWSFAIPRIERRVGRSGAFTLSAALLGVGGVALFADLRSPEIVLLATLLGGLLVTSSDIGPLPSLEQAALGSVSSDAERTAVFSRYNLLGYLGNAAGALGAAPIVSAGEGLSGPGRDSVFLLYAALGGILAVLYYRLSWHAVPTLAAGPPTALAAERRGPILRLSALFSVDAFGGGLVANFLVTLWLRARFDAPAGTIGAVLAVALVGAAISLTLAAPLARRIGLVRTMVFTHLPSSVLLILFALAPSLSLAAGLWVARSLLSQMDVPTRQSLVQALVAPSERTIAAGYTTAARSSSAGGGPVTGALLALGGPWLAAPFYLAGATKIAYDLALYAGFRSVPVPEESRAGAPARES